MWNLTVVEDTWLAFHTYQGFIQSHNIDQDRQMAKNVQYNFCKATYLMT